MFKATVTATYIPELGKNWKVYLPVFYIDDQDGMISTEQQAEDGDLPPIRPSTRSTHPSYNIHIERI